MKEKRGEVSKYPENNNLNILLGLDTYLHMHHGITFEISIYQDPTSLSCYVRSRPFPPLLLLRPKSHQSPLLPLLPRNLHNKKPHKIRQDPITTMRAQHVEILNIQGPTATRKEIVDLPVIVEEEHALFCNLLAGEVVGLQFYV